MEWDPLWFTKHEQTDVNVKQLYLLNKTKNLQQQCPDFYTENLLSLENASNIYEKQSRF